MEKRKIAEMNVVREDFYKALETMEFEGHEALGRAVEGLVYEGENGAVVVRVIVKQSDYDSEDAIKEFEEKQAEKEKKAAEKATKVAKAKAKKKEEEGA